MHSSNYFTLNNNQKFLKPQDVYALIKHFSFMIQQRLQQIQKTNNIYTCLNSFSSEKSDLQNYLIHRYDQYKTTDPTQLKLLDRLCERIIQIFLFYKQKCYQPANFINIQQKIQSKLRQLMQTTKSYQYFPNARPKTQKMHMHMNQSLNNSINKSNLNEQILYVCGSTNSHLDNSNLNQIIINQEVVSIQSNKNGQVNDNNKIVQVGTLFRYIFTILKKGYLLRLKVDKKKALNNNNNSTSCSSNLNTKILNETTNGNKIHIQGTQAMIRAVSSSQTSAKGNFKACSANMFSANFTGKLNQSSQNGKFPIEIINFDRRKTSASQFQKKYKNTKDFSSYHLSSNKDQQKTPNIRQIEKCLNRLYLDVLSDVQKYPLLRQTKNKQLFLKQAIKKNQFSYNQIKKYHQSYEKKHNIGVSIPQVRCIQADSSEGPQLIMKMDTQKRIPNKNLVNQAKNIGQKTLQIQPGLQIVYCYPEKPNNQFTTSLEYHQIYPKQYVSSKCSQNDCPTYLQKIQKQQIILQDQLEQSPKSLKNKKKSKTQQQSLSSDQKDFLYFLQKQNKINRISCMQKSKERKRIVLQNNQNRMNINATQLQKPSQNKNTNFSIITNDLKDALGEHTKFKSNDQNWNFKADICDYKDKMKHREDVYCPLPLMQNFINQQTLKNRTVQIAKKFKEASLRQNLSKSKKNSNNISGLDIKRKKEQKIRVKNTNLKQGSQLQQQLILKQEVQIWDDKYNYEKDQLQKQGQQIFQNFNHRNKSRRTKQQRQQKQKSSCYSLIEFEEASFIQNSFVKQKYSGEQACQTPVLKYTPVESIELNHKVKMVINIFFVINY